jgi:hypothetical protein
MLARAAELTALLRAWPDAALICETELRDPDLLLRGTPDLVLVGEPLVLIDLKTQTLKANELPDWVKFQLTIYSHLVRKQHGEIPPIVKVFSLNRGIISLDISTSEIDAALSTVAIARSLNSTETYPGLETCRFCQRRLECQPHWDAAAIWPVSDCIEGILEHVEVARNGATALLIRSTSGTAWVGGLPSGLFPAEPGAYVRMVRLRHVNVGNNEAGEWRWGPYSALSTSVT